MRLVRNVGADRAIDLIRPLFSAGQRLDLATPVVSLFAFAELLSRMDDLAGSRIILPPADADLSFHGGPADRAFRNRLQSRWLAKRVADWIRVKAEVRRAPGSVPQGMIAVTGEGGAPGRAIFGSVAFSTDGLGLVPGNPLNLIQTSETPEEASMLSPETRSVRDGCAL